jgi:hypothetical protein
MIGETRVLSEPEIEAWAEYYRIFEENPALNSYDRVSIHNAFPEIKEKFDKAAELTRAMRLWGELTRDYDEE